jgi:hypothetical protein
MSAAKRVIYSIKMYVTARFNGLFKSNQRSGVIERLMIQAIAERESEVVAAAKLLESDPDFGEYRALWEWADAQALDTLSRS